MLNSVVVSVVSFFVLQWLMIADASHFRHGTITWAPADSYSNRIRFIFRLAFRRSFSSYNCSQNAISSGILLGSGGSWRATCRNSLCSSTTVANTGFKCTDYSADEDWSMGENNFTYTFPSWDNEWVVSYQGCCWIGSLSRYPNGNWLVSTIVNLTRRTDSGRINSSPVSKSPAIVRFQEGCSQSLRIPVEDPDGDVVKCRRATYSESSRYTDSFPYGTLDENACLLSYDGKRGTSGTYAVALTLEDFPAGTTNFASISPFSAIGLQFLVIISGHYGSCADVPVFTASTPQDGQCSEVQIGSAYEAVIEVKLRDPSRHVVAIVTSSPIGMQTTYLRYQGGVFFKNVTWYPRQYQVGQQLFCFKAVDSIGLESEWRCVTILVGLSNTPRVIMGTRWPQSPKSEPGPGLNWWSIQFDRVIKKPRFSSYIRLVLLPSGYTVFKVDTLSQYVEITSNKTALLFALPKATLSMNGSYAIVIDQGAVVGLGCSYDGPPTPGISSLEDWAFDVDGVCSTGYYLAKPDYIRCVDVDECGAHSRKKRFVWWPNIISSSPTLTSAPATASVSLPSYQSECFNHTYLEDSVRGQGFYNGYYGYYQCDNNLPTGWYRFRGSAGTQMPTTCVGKNRCSSHAPGWLDASHPSVADGIINARVCFHWDYGCCHWYKNIRVRNCSGYYVYELGPTPTCWLRYCGNANYSNSSTPGISPTPVVTPAAAASQSPAVPGSCFYNLTDHQGNFTSPSHPYNYPHNLQCTWIISVTPGYYIHLYFHHFSLEYGASNCPFDYVDLFDQNFPTSSIKISRCGYQSAWCVYSSSNVLYVRFVTDGSVSNSGFLAHYERVHHEDPLDPGCIHLNDSYTSSIHATATHSSITTSIRVPAASASVSLPWYQSECLTHAFLEDSVRGQGFYNGYNGYYQCDRYLPFGWYRFRGAAGTQMPTTCVGKNRCSSHAPGWLNTSHPSVADGIVSGKVCFHWSSGCCTWSTNIRVRNCSGFYVYELGPPPACWLRYCGNGGGNYSTSSDTSISSTPAMTAGPADSSTILMSAPSPVPTSSTALSVTASTSPPSNQSVCSNHGILEDSVRGQGFYNGYYGYYQCDSGLPFGWYRFRGAAGTKMPTTCVGKNRCSSHAPGWLNTSHPSVADGIVSGKVCFHWYSECCYWSTNIRVRNCSGFYVYELRPPPTCWLRYCGNGGANYSTSSNTLLTPTPAMTSSATASRSFPVSGPCVYQFRGPNGNFSSPNHPYSYPHNMNCTWTITVTAGYRISLQFSHFSLEYGGSHCPYDYVEIFDQNFPLGSIKINRCGYQSSWCVYSSSNVLYVRFVTDSSVSNSGFRAQYESVHYGNPLHPSCIHLNASSMTSIQATRTLSSAPMSTPSTKVSPTSSSNFYAYSSVAAISSPDFELHLPADCEQICSNTLGSYTCSCVSGYHLAADRKSCSDIDECSVNNGGCSHSCYNIPGSFYCGCPEGTTMAANNLTCVEPGVSVTCGENNMTVSLEKQLFPFFQVDQLHLRYSSCRATQNSTHLLISTPLNGCGTSVNETQDALIFWNAILSDAVIIDNVITRSHDIRMPFYCSYSRKKLLSLSFTPQWIYFGNEVGYGNFTFRMDFFKSDSFLSPYGEDDYPLELRLNEYMYVRYSVESSADLVIMAENCKATKSASMYSWPQYSIIENGCPRDTTMDYSYDPAQSHQQFKIKTFRFFNDYDIVYFHCELLACHRYSPNSRCSRGCAPRNKRKRRDVTRDDVEHEESTTKNVVTRGPLIVKEKVNTGDTGQSKNAALIGGMAGAGGFGLIAVIALAVLFVKYRIARRFMNRNKVGDIYTTQEQQMSRKNAYIQEDDMIEKDDSF